MSKGLDKQSALIAKLNSDVLRTRDEILTSAKKELNVKKAIKDWDKSDAAKDFSKGQKKLPKKSRTELPDSYKVSVALAKLADAEYNKRTENGTKPLFSIPQELRGDLSEVQFSELSSLLNEAFRVDLTRSRELDGARLKGPETSAEAFYKEMKQNFARDAIFLIQKSTIFGKDVAGNPFVTDYNALDIALKGRVVSRGDSNSLKDTFLRAFEGNILDPLIEDFTNRSKITGVASIVATEDVAKELSNKIYAKYPFASVQSSTMEFIAKSLDLSDCTSSDDILNKPKNAALLTQSSLINIESMGLIAGSNIATSVFAQISSRDSTEEQKSADLKATRESLSAEYKSLSASLSASKSGSQGKSAKSINKAIDAPKVAGSRGGSEKKEITKLVLPQQDTKSRADSPRDVSSKKVVINPQVKDKALDDPHYVTRSVNENGVEVVKIVSSPRITKVEEKSSIEDFYDAQKKKRSHSLRAAAASSALIPLAGGVIYAPVVSCYFKKANDADKALRTLDNASPIKDKSFSAALRHIDEDAGKRKDALKAASAIVDVAFNNVYGSKDREVIPQEVVDSRKLAAIYATAYEAAYKAALADTDRTDDLTELLTAKLKSANSKKTGAGKIWSNAVNKGGKNHITLGNSFSGYDLSKALKDSKALEDFDKKKGQNAVIEKKDLFAARSSSKSEESSSEISDIKLPIANKVTAFMGKAEAPKVLEKDTTKYQSPELDKSSLEKPIENVEINLEMTNKGTSKNPKFKRLVSKSRTASDAPKLGKIETKKSESITTSAAETATPRTRGERKYKGAFKELLKNPNDENKRASYIETLKKNAEQRSSTNTQGRTL